MPCNPKEDSTMDREQYIIRLNSLVANEKHLIEDLESYKDTAMVNYLEVALVKTRRSIDELHQKIERINLAARG